MLHWLANERQGPFPCSVPLVLRARLHIFPTRNHTFFSGGPILALKRNEKRPCWLQTYTFPMKNQQFQKKSTFFMKKSIPIRQKSCSKLRILFNAPDDSIPVQTCLRQESCSKLRILFKSRDDSIALETCRATPCFTG